MYGKEETDSEVLVVENRPESLLIAFKAEAGSEHRTEQLSH